MYKNPLHSSILTLKFQKKKFKNSFCNENKKIKHRGVNLTKDGKDLLYTEKYEALLQEFKKDPMKWQGLFKWAGFHQRFRKPGE